MKKKVVVIIILSVVYFTLIFLGILFYFDLTLSKKIKITYENYINNDLEYDVNVKFSANKKNVYCSIDNIDWKKIEDCNFSLDSGNYKIYLKNDFFYITKKFSIEKKLLGSFESSIDNLDEYYLALDGKKKIDFKFDYPDNFDTSVVWNIENEKIISIKDDVMYGENVGTTKISATLKDGNKKIYTIVVTDLITPMEINNDKKYLPCGHYSDKENKLLDKILESRVKEAGVGTRGGVVAAARFLTLEFPYSITYFYENGRLVDHGYRPHLDGEGRYYHMGLYLSESKYDTLESGASSKSGPKMWGCDLYNSTTKSNNMNGLDCSGFVTWAMFNGGFNVGDVGAGNFPEFNDDLSDLGKKNNITKDYIKNGDYKVGDFIGRHKHAGLIIGIDDDNIYTAEALPPKLKVYTYDKNSKIFNNSNVKYIIEMSDIYPNGEGIYTDMW